MLERTKNVQWYYVFLALDESMDKHNLKKRENKKVVIIM